MKKIALKSLVVAIFLSVVTALGVSAPALASGGPAISNAGASVNYRGYTNQVLRDGPTFTTSGFSGTVTFSASPTLPAGLSINSATGAITGTPTQGQADTTYTITATDGIATATVNIHFTIVQILTVTSSVSSLPASTLLAQPFTITFGHGSLTTSNAGRISINVQNGTMANTASCVGAVSLDVSSTGCVANVNGSYVNYTYSGVDLSNPSATFVVTFPAGSFTTPASGYIFPNVNIGDTNGDFLNAGAPLIQIGSSAPAPAPAPAAPTATVDLTAALGQSVFGAPAPYSASGLQVGSSYDITVRSTPQIIAQGTVPAGGTVTGSATIPAGLPAGWHTITFTTTAANGTETKDVVWFKIDASGNLLSKSETQPAELAYTPAPPTQYWFWAMLILALGLGAFIYGREFSPEFMRVMSLVRDEEGDLVFVKRRIRSEDF